MTQLLGRAAFPPGPGPGGAPFVVAMMLDQLAVQPDNKVVEIGAGTGYNATLPARLTGQNDLVTSIDIDPDVTAQATRNLTAAGHGEILTDLVAQHAAVARAGATHEHHLNAALVNRDILGQAEGILMQRDRLTGQQAFKLLVRTSQETNMKLADVARWLVTDTENHTRDQN